MWLKLGVLLSLLLDLVGAEKIAVIGAGSWGTSVAYKLGQNQPSAEVALWTFEEVLSDGRNLTAVINDDRINSKYLPNTRLPLGIRASSSMEDVCRDASVLVVVVPHQFLPATLRAMAPHVDRSAAAVSCIKGLSLSPDGVELLSDSIQRELGLQEPCAVLMGANVATDVASDQFVEATVACRSPVIAQRISRLFHSRSLDIAVTSDVFTVEICGALKNIVALGAGFCDGLGIGASTKAAIMRRGLQEIGDFCRLFHPGAKIIPDHELRLIISEALLQSCGVGDVIASCLGGRNRACAEEFVRRALKKSGEDAKVVVAEAKEGQSGSNNLEWAEIESKLLSGQKLQGLLTSDEAWACLEKKLSVPVAHATFPLLSAINGISRRGWAPRCILGGWGLQSGDKEDSFESDPTAP